MDSVDIWGPKGKTPWISINGQHIPDSQFIVEFLGKLVLPHAPTHFILHKKRLMFQKSFKSLENLRKISKAHIQRIN